MRKFTPLLFVLIVEALTASGQSDSPSLVVLKESFSEPVITQGTLNHYETHESNGMIRITDRVVIFSADSSLLGERRRISITSGFDPSEVPASERGEEIIYITGGHKCTVSILFDRAIALHDTRRYTAAADEVRDCHGKLGTMILEVAPIHGGGANVAYRFNDKTLVCQYSFAGASVQHVACEKKGLPGVRHYAFNVDRNLSNGSAPYIPLAYLLVY